MSNIMAIYEDGLIKIRWSNGDKTYFVALHELIACYENYLEEQEHERSSDI